MTKTTKDIDRTTLETTSTNGDLEQRLQGISLSVLPTSKANAINCYGGGLPIRVNCQTGNFTNSKQEPLGNKMSVNIIKATRFFGDLGMTKGVEWLQLFYIPTHDCKFIPKNTVCYSYIKTQSLSYFTELVTYVGNQTDEDPAMGLFDLSFSRVQGNYGTYYVLDSQWRKRQTDEEFEQLIKVHHFLQHEPQLEDWRGTAEMVRVEELSEEEYRRLIAQALEDKKEAKN